MEIYLRLCCLPTPEATYHWMQTQDQRAYQRTLTSHGTLAYQWSPIQYRIQFKILLMTFKVLCGEAPSYLCDLITPYVPTRTLRSQNKLLLHQPRFHLKSYGQRAFMTSAPCLWNDLPYNIKRSKDTNDFKKKLKTHLFKKGFAL